MFAQADTENSEIIHSLGHRMFCDLSQPIYCGSFGNFIVRFQVLEKYPNTPMSHKEILQVIQRERLKEIR